MALRKLSGNPFGNIKTWLYERTKIITPNPLKPFQKKKSSKKEANFNHLQKILRKTHAPNGLINEIIDEVNDLIKRVSKLEKRMDIAETDIDKNQADIKSLTNRVTNIENSTKRYRPKNDSNITQIKTKHATDIAALKAQLTALQTTVTTLQASKSMLGHIHESAMGPTSPSLMKEGGRTVPVPSSHN